MYSLPRLRSLLLLCLLAPLPRAHASPNPAANSDANGAVSPAPVARPVAPAVAAAPAPMAVDNSFRWASGNVGAVEHPLGAGPLTLELRLDTALHYSLAAPRDNTLTGSSEVFRHGEVQLTHVGIGGDLDYKNVQARLLLQLGLYAQTTPRNDASPSRGQWQLDNALRYLSEGYVGYHFDVLRGVNVQAGLFMSYIGLWSYYNFDNWTYQPSYVSSNTPWFFNGVRMQVFVTDKLKLEPWLVNGWQSYGRFNNAPGVGMQAMYRPTGNVSMVTNLYYGTDTPGNSGRKRFHSDSSLLLRYYNRPGAWLSQAAASVTFDGGFENGGGVHARTQYFLGAMAYNRLWFMQGRLGATVGGGFVKNPGRYLVLLPPINGATATSGTPYFTANPTEPYLAWDLQATFDVMPTAFSTLRLEFNHRQANVPYFSGRGGVTPPGGNAGAAGSAVSGWAPDLRRQENRFTLAFLVKM